jgi:hypothetical protein
VIEIPGYRLLRQLGRGGMATVYLAVQESVDREVALKLMSPALLVDPDFGNRFQREARIAARLHHRHVVGIHDVGRAGDYHYMAMEYLARGPVLTKDGMSRPVPFVLRVMREIATALNYAHEKGFIHRDVKPDNILLRDDGSSALTDFGIARTNDAAGRMTKTGAVVGTPHYMSPEQARGKQIDGRCDIYSLGIVLYELLVGRVPYHAEDSLAVGIMHITQPVPVLPDSARELQPLIERMLAKEPEDRFQTGNEVAAAIAALEQRVDAGDLHALGLPQEPGRGPAPETFVSPVPFTTPGDDGYSRAEPNLGRLDEIVAAVDDDVMRAERVARAPTRRPRRRSGRRLALLAMLLVVAAAGTWAWRHQDRLRLLLPRTELNATLVRAQAALAQGKLDGSPDSARQLFESVRSEDPDNDAARHGLGEVGQRLLGRARAALAQGDGAAARQSLAAARELLGGGSAVDELARQLEQADAQKASAAGLLDQANAALAAGRILGNDGAAAEFRRLLDADPASALAQAGLQKCAAALAAEAGAAIDANDLTTAAARGDDIARILPNWPGLPDLLGRITQAREAAHNQVDTLLRQGNDRLRAGNVSTTPDSAEAAFAAAQKLDPGNADAAAGLRRVAQALVIQAEAAIDDSNGERADQLLTRAATLAPDLPELRAGRTALRELRERLDIAATPAAVSAADSERVAALVAAAQTAAQAGNLIVPPGDCAYDKYRAALALDGNNAAALAGLARLPARARELFDDALAQRQPFRARGLLDTVRQLAPGDPSLASLSRRLVDAFVDLAEQRTDAGLASDAARALEAARKLAPDDPRLAAIDARLRARAHGPG